MLTGAEIRDAIDAVYPLEPEPREPSSTARVYRFADGRGRIGFINPVSEPFCGDCNRIRLTADGRLRTCLFSLNETDLRAPMRDGATDDELEEIVRDAVWRKELKHHVGRAGLHPAGAHDVRHRRLGAHAARASPRTCRVSTPARRGVRVAFGSAARRYAGVRCSGTAASGRGRERLARSSGTGITSHSSLVRWRFSTLCLSERRNVQQRRAERPFFYVVRVFRIDWPWKT